MKGYKKQLNKNLSNGFTLIELMVSLTIFSIVMLISTGTLLIMIDVNAKAQAIYSSTSNLTFAVDNITRELRTGYHYYCSNNPPPDGSDLPINTTDCTDDTFIAFTKEQDSVRIGYRLNVAESRIEQKIEAGAWVPLTSDDVVITDFDISAQNTSPYYSSSNTSQPTVDIFINGYVNNGLDTDTDFTLQSHVIQRRLDII